MWKKSSGLVLLLALPFLFSGCRVVVWGYTNTSLPNRSSGSSTAWRSSRVGLTARVSVATSRHRAVQSSLSQARQSAAAARQQAADLAAAKAEQTRETIKVEIDDKGQENGADSESGNSQRRYPS